MSERTLVQIVQCTSVVGCVQILYSIIFGFSSLLMWYIISNGQDENSLDMAYSCVELIDK